MSQAPTEFVDLGEDHPYYQGFGEMAHLVRRQGMSFSGNERNCCFLNTRGERFADISSAAGLDLPDDGRGLAVVDWDQDGDLDLWFSNRTGPRVRLMRNDLPPTQRYLSVRLRGNGLTSNPDAIGARLQLHVTGGDGSRKLHRSLRAGEGFLSQSSKWVHFGLGQAESIDRLLVRWPGDGHLSEYRDLDINARYRITQGDAQARRIKGPRREVRLQASQAKAGAPSERARVVLLERIELAESEYVDFAGKRHRLPGPGHPVLVNLWASWCQPCVSELAEFQAHWPTIGEAGIDVVALSTDGVGEGPADGPAAAAALIEKNKYWFATGKASKELLTTLSKINEQSVARQRPLPLPASFLIDRHGKVAVIYKGRVSPEQLAEDVNLLDAQPARIEAAAFPFPGRGAGELLPNSHIARALAYREGGYLEDARNEMLKFFLFLNEAMAKPGPPPVTDRQAGEAFFLLASILEEESRFAESLRPYERAVELLGNDPNATAAYAHAQHAAGDTEACEATLHKLRLSEEPASMLAAAQTYLRLEEYGQAGALLQRVLRKHPDAAGTRFQLATTLQFQGRHAQAVEHFELLLEDKGLAQQASNNLAWLLSTSPEAGVRDGGRALVLARAICRDTGHAQPRWLDTLAAAQAEMGLFEDATTTAQHGLILARATGQGELADELVQRLNLYRQSKPYRQH